MSWLAQCWRSSIGGKQVVAVTGALLVVFLVVHLAGNLLVFGGRDAMNAYAAGLEGLPVLLWTLRLGLLAVFVLHVVSALRLHRENRAARPVRYAMEDTVEASWASRHMVLSGLVVLAFLLYHLAHFTLGWTHPEHFVRFDTEGRHDVYAMVVLGFQVPWVGLLYVAAQVLLFFHLVHGFGSLFQTLGVRHERYTPWIEGLGRVVAFGITGGNVLICVLVGLGRVPDPVVVP